MPVCSRTEHVLRAIHGRFLRVEGPSTRLLHVPRHLFVVWLICPRRSLDPLSDIRLKYGAGCRLSLRHQLITRSPSRALGRLSYLRVCPFGRSPGRRMTPGMVTFVTHGSPTKTR